ncbi:DUF1501 domain-containing protein [Litorisediminicola beolgyonensis]|uniref:DUF1501 domain-containing protein n=1 Tax=Litorisediminicola beolgyonensis TaxID=1173614 RepID=A0ABW3ZG75_9RHOB
MVSRPVSRRMFLGQTLGIGCSLAASPLLTQVSLAGAPGDNRLVVIILRGAMDGLDALRPVGDPGYTALGRGALAAGGTRLDDRFTLHPRLAPLMPLWEAGAFGAAHAVSTPYRDGRSHFDGQDLLEAGDLSQTGARDGWLNRLLTLLPQGPTETAYAVGDDALKLLDGAAPVLRWAPEADLALSPQAVSLTELVMQEDPRFAASFAQALRIAGGDGDPVEVADQAAMRAALGSDQKGGRGPNSAVRAIAEFVAARLREESRIAAFSINGWDSHDRQDATLGRALDRLSEAILTLRDGLGPEWERTAVLAMTEFGRTARLNGTNGTDHGTGGAMFLAGGALAGGRIVTDWPGLSEEALYDRRDLMPTRDVRAHAGWVLRGLFGIGASDLERVVFPGLDLGADPGWIA